MPLRLYLLRHAQSAEKQIGQSDKDRELTSRGMKDSLMIGDYLKKHSYLIDQVVTSTAIRARETSRLLVEGLKADDRLITESDDLYEASPRTFLDFIHALDNGSRNVLCVAHNPSISYVAEYVTRAEIPDLAPAGLVIIDFPFQSWSEVQQGNGQLVAHIHPELLGIS